MARTTSRSAPFPEWVPFVPHRWEPYPWLKPGIFVGGLVPLTSTTDSIRKLGYQRWVRLHQLVYVAAGLAALHFFWRVKIDIQQPLVYAVIIGALLAVRLGFWLRKRKT